MRLFRRCLRGKHVGIDHYAHDNWRSMAVSGQIEKEATGLRFRRRAFASAFTREEQNCRGAINNEERRRRKKRCLPEIEILVPRLKQQLKARYSRPSINYSRNRPGVSRGSGSSGRSERQTRRGNGGWNRWFQRDPKSYQQGLIAVFLSSNFSSQTQEAKRDKERLSRNVIEEAKWNCKARRDVFE